MRRQSQLLGRPIAPQVKRVIFARGLETQLQLRQLALSAPDRAVADELSRLEGRPADEPQDFVLVDPYQFMMEMFP